MPRPAPTQRASWSTASSAVSCPYCSHVAAKSHQLCCPKRPMRCPQCQLQTTAASMVAHQQGECPMRKAPCPGCGDVILETALRDHILSVCTARSFTCATCGEVYWIAGEFIEHAIPRCERAVVPCQLCGHAVATSVLAEHYRVCAAATLEGMRPSHRGIRRTIGDQSAGGSTVDVAPSVSPWRGGHAEDGVNEGDASCSIPVAYARGSAARPFSAPATRRGFSPLRTSPARLYQASRQAHVHDAEPQLRTTSVSPSRNVSQRNRPATASHARPAPAVPLPLHHRHSLHDAPLMHSNDRQQHHNEHAVAPVVRPVPFGDNLHVSNTTTATQQHANRNHNACNHDDAKHPPPLVSRTTHASALRVDAALERIRGGPTSLAVKDRRRQALSDVIRRRENADRLLSQISHTPQLPAFVAQPLPAPTSLEPLRKHIQK